MNDAIVTQKTGNVNSQDVQPYRERRIAMGRNKSRQNPTMVWSA
jgi:hypothetical protein